MTLTYADVCSGYGGLGMVVESVFGAELSWYADVDASADAVMKHHHPYVSNAVDITSLDWLSMPFVDILSAGYPCQPWSAAGKRKGKDDERHIWPHIAEGIGLLRPRVVVLENVANHLRLGFSDVLADLTRIRYDAAWCVVSAAGIAGTVHLRKRLFVVAADADRAGLPLGSFEPDRDECPATVRSGGTPDAHTESDGWNEWRSLNEGPPRAGHAAEHRGNGGQSAAEITAAWGEYAPAVARWERLMDRAVPHPVTTGARCSGDGAAVDRVDDGSAGGVHHRRAGPDPEPDDQAVR